jgi:hypothetical protein
VLRLIILLAHVLLFENAPPILSNFTKKKSYKIKVRCFEEAKLAHSD